MSIEHLRRAWDTLGRKDPFWAVLTQPDKRNNRWHPDEFFRTGEEEIAALFRSLDGRTLAVNRGRCLDFGCGVGRLTQALCRYFERVDGVDIARSMVERAQKLNQHPDRCRYHLNVSPDLRLFGDSTFDFVYSNIVLQHMAPEFGEKYLAEFLRVLAPAGMAVFQVPSCRRPSPPRSLARRWSGALRVMTRRSGPFEMHAVRRERVVSLVESAGGEILAIEDFPVSGPEWENYRYFVRRR